jgi:hypothetical protein
MYFRTALHNSSLDAAAWPSKLWGLAMKGSMENVFDIADRTQPDLCTVRYGRSSFCQESLYALVYIHQGFRVLYCIV